jgi:predicted Zn-dependent peptidase
LQKSRIAIIASFAKLIPILHSRSDKDLKKWNYFAQILLTQISEMLVKTRLNQNKYDKSNSDSLKSTFDYFDVPDKEVDSILQSIY